MRIFCFDDCAARLVIDDDIEMFHYQGLLLRDVFTIIGARASRRLPFP